MPTKAQTSGNEIISTKIINKIKDGEVSTTLSIARTVAPLGILETPGFLISRAGFPAAASFSITDTMSIVNIQGTAAHRLKRAISIWEDKTALLLLLGTSREGEGEER